MPNEKPKTTIRKVITKELQDKLEYRTRAYMETQREILDRAAGMPSGVSFVALNPKIPPPASALCADYMSKQAEAGKKNSQHAKECWLKHFLRWAKDRVFTRELLEEWVVECSKMDCSDTEKHMRARMPCAIARWAAATKRLDNDITVGIKLPRRGPQRARPLWTKEETDALIEFAAQRERTKKLIPIIALGWDTGMAIADCLTLKWKDVDMDRCVIRKERKKTGVLSTIPFEVGGRLHQVLKGLQEEAKARHGGVNPEANVIWQFVTREQYAHMEMSRFFKAAGVPKGKTFHSWRGTLVSNSIAEGVPTPVAMRIVGMKTTGIFNQYATVEEETIREHQSKLR